MGSSLPRALAVFAAAVAAWAHTAEPPARAELLPGHEVRYHARDQLTAWVGVAPLADVALELDPADLGRTRLRAVVRPGDFDSGVAFRDFSARRSVFATDEHPEATFVLDRLEGAALDLPDAATRRLRAFGTLTIRGTTREVEVDVEVRRDGAEVAVTATFEVSLADYDLPPPRFLTLVAEDRVGVEVELRVRLPPASTATTRGRGGPVRRPRATSRSVSAARR